jgi:hypothetical protein
MYVLHVIASAIVGAAPSLLLAAALAVSPNPAPPRHPIAPHPTRSVPAQPPAVYIAALPPIPPKPAPLPPVPPRPAPLSPTRWQVMHPRPTK